MNCSTLVAHPQVRAFSKSRLYRIVAAVALLAAGLITSSSAFAASPFYLSFSVPNSKATYPLSMNDLFTVTGYYVDQANVTHGFVRTFDGRISCFDVPGSLLTKPVAINNAGEITGYYQVGGTANGPAVQNPALGFVRSAKGTITTFGTTSEYPAILTQPVAINAAGEVIGNYPSYGLGSQAFLRSASVSLTEFTLNEGASYSTFITGLNTGGGVVGYFSSQDIKLANGFYWNGQGAVPSLYGGYQQITYPGATGTFPTGINAKGEIVGCYSIGSAYYDFSLTSRGVYTTLNVPGTVPSCTASLDYNNPGVYNVVPAQINVNNSGTAAGYTTSSGATIGFVRFANGTITQLAISGSSSTVPTSMNNFDVLTGYYMNGNGIVGFIALP